MPKVILDIELVLDTLKRSDFMKYLDLLEQSVSAEWESAHSDREATLAQGKKKLITRIRKDIEGAAAEIERHANPPPRKVGVY